MGTKIGHIDIEIGSRVGLWVNLSESHCLTVYQESGYKHIPDWTKIEPVAAQNVILSRGHMYKRSTGGSCR